MEKGKDLKKEWDAFIHTGSEEAYYALYSHYHDYLLYIAIQKSTSMARAKDCVNDLFLYVFENRENLQHIRSHHNYLVTAFLRKLFRKERFSSEESLEIELLPGAPVFPSAEVLYIRQQAREQATQVLQRYMDKLSLSQSKLIYQKFYLGLSYEEISAANGITVKTAYNTIYNAVEKLRKLMAAEHVGILSAAITVLTLLILFFLKNS